MTGAAYIRVSTEDQLEFSPDSQLKKIREYAGQHQITIPDDQIYVDEGISGRNAQKRPAFQQMIASARRRPTPFHVILVWKYSRFARNRQDSILYKSMLRKECGVDVVSVSEPLSDDPTSILVEALLEAMDEYYSLNLAGEVRRGMNEKFSRGQAVSVPPFGYRMGNSRFEPDEDTAPFVPLIYRKYSQGCSLRRIAAWLNSAGIRTARGNLFESRTVEYILSNPVYTGKLRRRISSDKAGAPKSPVSGTADRFYRGQDVQIVPASHIPLVPEELFDAVQKRLTRNRECVLPCSENASDTAQKAGILSGGILRCSACGSALVSAARGRALQCGAYAKGRCRSSHYISLRFLKPAVLQALEECPLFLHGASSYVQPPQSSLPPSDCRHPCSVRARIRAEEKRLERLRLAYEAGADSLEEYQQRKQEIRKKIAVLKETEKEGPEDSVSSCPSFSWNSQGLVRLLKSGVLTGKESNELLRLIFSCIIFSRAENRLQFVFRC